MKTLSIIITLLSIGLSIQAEAKPVICESSDRKVAAVLELEGPVVESYTRTICLKNDESDPGCNDYYAYTCPCIEYGKPQPVTHTFWKVSGKIRSNNRDLPLTRFTLENNGYVISGSRSMYTGNGIDDPWYKINLQKGVGEGDLLIAEIELYSNRVYGAPGTIINAVCRD